MVFSLEKNNKEACKSPFKDSGHSAPDLLGEEWENGYEKEALASSFKLMQPKDP